MPGSAGPVCLCPRHSLRHSLIPIVKELRGTDKSDILTFLDNSDTILVRKESRMPDRDVFSRHIPRGWETAARAAHSGLDDAVTRVKLLRALIKDMKQGGCPGIDEIADIVGDAKGSLDTAPQEGAWRRLEQVNRKYVCERTAAAVNSALSILAALSTAAPGASRFAEPSQIRFIVAKTFLIDFAMMQISSSALLSSLERNGDVSVSEYLQRQEHARQLLTNSLEVGTLARQLLVAPDGEQAKTPRLPIPKMTPEEMVSCALST